MIALRTGVVSHVGKVRTRNEDGYLVGAALFAVADGMGGHAAGDVASAIAVGQLGLLADRDRLTADDLRRKLIDANTEILASAADHPEQAGMGTTVAGLGLVQFAGGDHWAVFNVGDSRVYRFVEGTLVQMTVDHSEVAEAALAPSTSTRAPRRNIVTRVLGTRPGPDPDMWVFPPTPGERFLVCSDGLTSELVDPIIAQVLRDEPSPQQAAANLVDRAIWAGGRDNVTVMVIDHVADDDAGETDTMPRAPRTESP